MQDSGLKNKRTGMCAAVWPRSESVAQKTVKIRVAVRIVSSSQMDACAANKARQLCTHRSAECVPGAHSFS